MFISHNSVAIVSPYDGDRVLGTGNVHESHFERIPSMVRHLASVAEIVEDFNKAVQFYRDTLGLEVEVHNEGYADVTVPGTLHFGIWSRKEAAKATFGDYDAADRVPLGFTIGFEVDEVQPTEGRLRESGVQVLQPTKTEPWEQVTSRFLAPSGAFCEIAETPWARRITQPMLAE